jgi:hypothetical protein
MKKPELVLTSKPDDDFLTGSCSACEARFRLSGNTLKEKALLRAMFDNHALSIHAPSGDPATDETSSTGR